MVYLRKPATTIGHLTSQGIRIRIHVQGSRFGAPPTGAADSKVSISAGLSSQRSESETYPHAASQTRIALAAATSCSRNRPGISFQSRCYASEGDAHECDCESGQEPGELARGGVAAWQSHLLDRSGPLGAAETERAKLIWVSTRS